MCIHIEMYFNGNINDFSYKNFDLKEKTRLNLFNIGVYVTLSNQFIFDEHDLLCDNSTNDEYNGRQVRTDHVSFQNIY